MVSRAMPVLALLTLLGLLAVSMSACDEATPTPAAAPEPTPIPTPSLDPDRAALVALYNATDGLNWSSNTKWLSDAPLEEWSGVTSDDSGRVTSLRLSGNELSGRIPPELGSLSNLVGLYLSENQLSGEIPLELASLSNLWELSLSGNRLSGEIPPELSNLSKLELLGVCPRNNVLNDMRH